MQKRWDAFWNSKRDSRFTRTSQSKRRMMRILDNYIKEGMTVLDAGCGSGFFSNYFIAKGCRVYPLDYSQEALEITRRMTEDRASAYLHRDLLDKGLFSEYRKAFDVIFTDGLFEHFPHHQQKQIMETFMTIKKDSGIIVTFVPNQYSFWTLVRPVFMPGIEERPLTLKELAALAEESGQSIIEKGGINVLPLKASPEILGQWLGMLVYTVSS